MSDYGVVLFHTTSAALRFRWADQEAMQTTLAAARVAIADLQPLPARG